MKTYYSFIFLIFIFWGCSSEIEEIKQPFSPVSAVNETPTYRTKENAIIEVKNFIKKDGSSTRISSTNYTINNEVYYYRDTVTKKNNPSFYIANADNGNGYAIVSANPNTTPIIAYSETGNLLLSDTIRYKELSFFFNLIQKYISNTDKYKTEFEAEGTSSEVPQTRHRLPHYEKRPREWKETERIQPLISVKWGQRSPYNNAAPLIQGQRVLTGCVATAAAQVMSYHEKPSEYNGVTYNWAEMKKNPNSPSVAHLFRSIGDLVKMDWGIDASGAKRKNIPECFEKMWYRKPGTPQTYS